MTRTGNNQHKPVTLEIARQDFIDKGYIPLFNEYKNNATKMTAETKEGYRIYTSLGKIRQGKEPYIFGKNNPYTVDNIRLWIKLSGFPYELISTEYQSACNHKLTFECPIHGEFYATWNSVHSGNGGCYECRNKKIGNHFRLTLYEIKNRLKVISPYIEIISNEYENSTKPLKCKCLTCESEWDSNWGRLSQGTGCLQCFIEHQRGENHPKWKGGVSQLHEYLRGNIAEWKQDSFKKCEYRCDITNSNRSLVIHHLYNFSNIARETMDILGLPIYEEVNKYTECELKSIRTIILKLHYKYGLGVCLTEDIHKEFHNIYGNDNTKEQYIEFRNKKIEGNKKTSII